MIRKQSPKRLSDIASGKVKVGHNSTIAVKPIEYRQSMTPEEYREYVASKAQKAVAKLFTSGGITKASKVGKSDRAKWKAKADKWFSEFIRLRDSDEFGMAYCVTSRKRVRKFWRLMDCGHWISRAKESTRYDERNCHAQSKRANQYQGGHFLEHELAIERIHGKGTAQQLRDKAGQVCKRTAGDYRFLAESYKARVDRIKETEPGRYFGKGAI